MPTYVHTPRDISRTSLLYRLNRPACGGRATPIRPILGFWGCKIPQKREIPCLGRRWTAVQNLTPKALSSAEKSATVQNKQTNNITNSNRYIHTNMCGASQDKRTPKGNASNKCKVNILQCRSDEAAPGVMEDSYPKILARAYTLYVSL